MSRRKASGRTNSRLIVTLAVAVLAWLVLEAQLEKMPRGQQAAPLTIVGESIPIRTPQPWNDPQQLRSGR